MERLAVFAELLRMLWRHRTWVLLPPTLVLALVAALVVLSQAPAVAPFLYPLF